MAALTTTPQAAMTSTDALVCRRRLAQDRIGTVVLALAGGNVFALAEGGMR
jgi:hypothetical protein